MRAVGLHADVVVATSRIWQTTCTLVRAGGEAFCIDSPVLPDELELLRALAAQSGFEVVGLLATHGDWDHVLGPYAFPEAPLGVAPSTAATLRSGAAQRALRAFDEEHYIERDGPLQLGAVQELPVPGRCGIEERELELHPTAGHTGDGMAIWAPWARVLVCGDYLSPVEIPMLHESGALEPYLETLDRLEPLAEVAEWVVPGHGAPLESTRALAILGEDRAYLEALRDRGQDAPLPLARRTPRQRAIHRTNVERAG